MTAARRIALVYDDSLDRPGGVAQYVETLAGRLRARGHDVSLLVGETEDVRPGRRSLARNLKVRFNGNILTVPLRARAADLDAVLEDLRPDVLHVQVPYSPLLAGRLIARAADTTAVVGTSHVFSERSWVRAGARLLSHASAGTHRRFDRVVAVSEPARSFAERYSGMRVDAVIPNMVDLAAFPARSGTPRTADAPPHFAFVGNLVARKGVGFLIAALPRVHARHPGAVLSVAGDGPLRSRLQRQARTLGMHDHVRFIGTVSEHAKVALLHDADVACFPSVYGESFGIVLLEAMACDALVLAGENAGYRSMLATLPDALVDPRDTQALSEALLAACDGRDQLTWRRERQRQLARRHSAERVCTQLLEEYELALARRRSIAPKPLAHVA